MDNGWIKLHRKFLEWEWFDKPEMVQLFIFLLLSANHADNDWRGMTIKRGQLVTSYASIKEKTGLSVQTIRTCIRRLKSTSELTSKVTSQFTIITICNYDSYQQTENATNKPINKRTNKPLTSNQQATNKQSTTNKNDKNDKNDKKNTNSKFDFKKALLDYGLDEMLVDEWLVIRKAKKSVNSQFAFNSFISQVEKTNMDKNEVLKIVAEKQWAGFNSNWLKNLNRNNGKDRRDSEAADRERQIMQLARDAGMA